MKQRPIILISTFLTVFFMSDSTAFENGSGFACKRFLIVTADDFGASENINEGIEIAADKQVITTISALTNFPESLPLLKNISKNHPDIGIGSHLNITTGKPVLSAQEIPSLVNDKGIFFTVDELLPKLSSIVIVDLKKELRAQIMALVNIDIQVDHLSDQNGILSFYSPFFDIVTELALEFNVPIRTPEIASIKYPDLFPNSCMKQNGRKKAMKLSIQNPIKAFRLLKYARIQEIEKKVQMLDGLGIPHPDLLIEYFWGNPTIANLNHILEQLPEGTSELVLHLGTDTRQENYPSGLDIDYFINREKELATITEKHLIKYCNTLNIRTIGYDTLIKSTR